MEILHSKRGSSQPTIFLLLLHFFFFVKFIFNSKMFNDKISQRNYPVRAGYCVSYYLCESSHWHPRALVMQSPTAPKLCSDKDIPWLVSWAIASFSLRVCGENASILLQCTEQWGKVLQVWAWPLTLCCEHPAPPGLAFFISCSLKLKALPAMGLLSLCACNALLTGT